ncbi:uncharacterized protein LOC106135589 [Amyelois transitella]|uniref:uncharacterized protein LOC106135589 n=1 Tax=Amyelois transitella TaxID=680683 RepID=UPI00298FC9FB|nr:uncharacterized protein LOC106135589 [Amyelois transitella]
MKIFLLLVFVLLFCRDMSLTAQDYHEKYVILCSNYHLHKKENINFEESFLDVAESFGYKLKRVTSNCDLAETLKYSEFYRNSVVINFNLIDFGNAIEVNKLGSYDGNIIVEYYDKLNNSICEYNSKNNQTDMYGRNCSGPAFNAKNKIFVGSIEENTALFNVFRAITDKHIKVKNNFRNILLCSDICDSYIINTQFHIICEQCDKEFECDNNTIAIVAPTPEKVKVPFNENIPIIFYDTFYMEEDFGEDTDVSIYDYDTSTTSIHWKALSTMTIDVINSRIWERIAVISDDSALSKILRNDLIENFVKKSVLFAIRKCSEVDEFKKTLILFKEVRAPIIIVYVAKRNLGKFIRSAQEVEMAKDDVIWVFPGYKENDIKGFKYATFIYCKPEYEVALSIVIHKYKRAFGNEDKFRK